MANPKDPPEMAGTNPPNLEENRGVFMGLPWFSTLELHIPYIDIPKLYVDSGIGMHRSETGSLLDASNKTKTLDRSMVPFSHARNSHSPSESRSSKSSLSLGLNSAPA